MSNVFDCSLMELPRIASASGNLTPVYGGKSLPFEIERVFYLYDIPGGIARGGHAHRQLHQFIVAASGSFDFLMDDGYNRRVVTLNRPYYGLHVTNMIWGELFNFSSGGICLVLASAHYEEADYFRDYDEFQQAVRSGREP